MWLQQLPNGTSLHNVMAWYDFRGGSLTDRSPNERHLTNNSATAGSEDIHAGYYYTLDGATGNLEVADFLGAGDLTLCVWINMTGWGEADVGRVITNDKVVMFVEDANDRFNFTSDGATVINAATSSLSLATWHFLCATRTAAGVANLYVDGALSGSADQDSGTPEAGTSDFTVGNRQLDTNTFDGKIGPILVFNKVLTNVQIGQMYNKHK